MPDIILFPLEPLIFRLSEKKVLVLLPLLETLNEITLNPETFSWVEIPSFLMKNDFFFSF